MPFTQATIATLFGLVENALAENDKVEVKALGRTWRTTWLGEGRLRASDGQYYFEGVPEEIARDVKLQAAPVIEIGIEFPKTTQRWRSVFPAAATTKLVNCRFTVTLKG